MVPILQHRPPRDRRRLAGHTQPRRFAGRRLQQTPDNSRETQRRNRRSFASLVDVGGKVAHAFGLRWKVSDELRAVEESCGIDLAAFNGDPSWTLTMPARYVVAPGGMIEYADISVDYTRRGDPSELIPVLAHLAAH
jgi:peroxiredoxin